MMAKFTTTASAKAPAVKLRNEIVAAPAVKFDTYTEYAPVVAPLEMQTISVSLALIKLLFKVNDTVVTVASEAAFIVMRPEDLFKVTAVDLSVN